MHDRLKAYDLGGGERTAAAAHIPHLTRSASAGSPDSTSITLDMQNGAATSKPDAEKVWPHDIPVTAVYQTPCHF